MSPSVKISNFREVQKFKADYCPAELALYESSLTGMRVMTVNQKGPKVWGYFTLATEIHDDSGSPHTLEHLIFMGSKSYKYQGLLSKLSNRAFSDLNAWTATDHTAYTLETAGWDGFSQILPVYLEHVLLPTLTDAACYTEVHHVDGIGHDAGVVYCEMQGRQNEQSDVMERLSRRLLYPKESGFRSDTGGLMETLRVLTAERIRDYHKEMYRPQNLCLILIGEIDHPHLFEILDQFEEGIKSDVPLIDDSFERPFSKTGKVSRLQKSSTEVVEFPEEDESIGEVLIGFLGPDINNDLLVDALSVMLIYLCGSSISVLENALVETEQLASAVYYSTDSRPDMVIWFTITGVETDKLDFVKKRFFEVIQNTSKSPLDTAYMRDCLVRHRRQLKFYSEMSGNFFSDQLIADHLYGTRDGQTFRNVGSLGSLDILELWDEGAWKRFLNEWFVDAHSVSVTGIPSRKLAKKLKREEEARVKAQQEKLGKDGLQRLAKKLEEAKAENEVKIPDELVQRFAVPETDSVHFIPTITARSGFAKDLGKLDNNVQRRIDDDAGDTPLFIHFEHIPSNFVRMYLFLGTHSIPAELRPLLPVFLGNFFDTPIMRDGKRVEFENVVTLLEKDTIDYNISYGRGFSNSESLVIKLEVEPEKYETAICWLRDFLFHSIFDVNRLKATLAKLIADIPEEKRNGDSMASCVLNILHSSRESTVRAHNTLIKSVCLRRTLALLEETPEAVIAKFESVRKHLTAPSNFRVLVVADIDSPTKLPTPVSSWRHLTAKFTPPTSTTLASLDSYYSTLTPAGLHPGSIAHIVPIPATDSSYARFSTRGPNTFSDPSLPALFVSLAYLDALEGPLWVAVRGAGLAYGCNFSKSLESGRVALVIYRSPDAHRAFVAARGAVDALASGEVPVDASALEGAVSSIVVGFADEQPTMAGAAEVSFMNQVVRGVGKHWERGFMARVKDVTAEDVRRVLREVVMRVFDAKAADMVVTCSEIMTEKLAEGFQSEGFGATVKPLSEFRDDYGMEGAELVDEDAMDDGDSEEDDEEDDEDAEAGEDEDGDSESA